MQAWSGGLIAIWLLASGAQAEMAAVLQPPWDGLTVPPGQQCPVDGGQGATPAIATSGLPAGTATIRLEFNDLNYVPLGTKGGHGVIEFPVTGIEALLPSVPAMTADLPDGAVLVSKARSTGKYASDGYLPPCSGGNGNLYAVTVKALDASGTVLEKLTVELGHY